MKISAIIVLLSLMVKDVFTLRGLYLAEVDILPEGKVPADTEDEVTCTMATIEPAGTDVKFVKYIASIEEQTCDWRDNNTALNFEDCADAAAASGSKMFLYDGGRCRISDRVYEQTDLCNKTHSQMVYMDIDAVPDISELVIPDTREFFCNYDRSMICKNGRLVYDVTANGGDLCGNKIEKVLTIEGLYHLISSNSELPISEHYLKCAKFGALPCAPKDESSLDEYMNHLTKLEETISYPYDDFAVGLNSTNNGNDFVWATGVPMPNDHVGWNNAQNPQNGKNCGYIGDDGVYTSTCTQNIQYCCMVPYYAD